MFLGVLLAHLILLTNLLLPETFYILNEATEIKDNVSLPKKKKNHNIYLPFGISLRVVQYEYCHVHSSMYYCEVLPRMLFTV